MTAAVSPGQTCVTGQIMDVFCIDRGTLLDNNAVRTLEGPQLHSLKCLVDVALCTSTLFELLEDTPSVGGITHCRVLQLDRASTDLAIAFGRAQGRPASRGSRCSTCTGASGDMVQGLRARAASGASARL